MRKNKTIAAGFKSLNVIEILEKNYKTWLATQENGDSMVVDNKADLKGLIKEKITKVLTETGFSDQRAGKLDQTDFLKLLYAFHQVGIHFA